VFLVFLPLAGRQYPCLPSSTSLRLYSKAPQYLQEERDTSFKLMEKFVRCDGNILDCSTRTQGETLKERVESKGRECSGARACVCLPHRMQDQSSSKYLHLHLVCRSTSDLSHHCSAGRQAAVVSGGDLHQLKLLAFPPYRISSDAVLQDP